MVFSIGSVAQDIQDRVDNIPTSVSGTVIGLVDEQRLFMEEYTGLSIGSTSINDKYRPAMTDLSTASILQYLQVQGADASNIRLGDFSIGKGSDSNVASASKTFMTSGMEKLKRLGTGIRFARVLG